MNVENAFALKQLAMSMNILTIKGSLLTSLNKLQLLKPARDFHHFRMENPYTNGP